MSKRLLIAERFWTKVDRRGQDECWLWTGNSNHGGYGEIYGGPERPKTIRAHRLSYELHYSPIPVGLCVLHHCDTPLCVNPAHLFLGTHADNTADKCAKVRQLKGERINHAKLTVAQVVAIRDTVGPYSRIAAQYGVGKSTIHRVKSRQCWAHVP